MGSSVVALPTMPESVRRFLCALCRTEVFICTACDRNQQYCAGDCARAARRRKQREANHRYQRTFNGRLNGAARSQRYRENQRETQGVTDHSSLADRPRGVLDASATSAVAENLSDGRSSPIASSESGVATGDALQCSFCGCWYSRWIRHGPLRRRPRSGYIRKERRL